MRFFSSGKSEDSRSAGNGKAGRSGMEGSTNGPRDAGRANKKGTPREPNKVGRVGEATSRPKSEIFRSASAGNEQTGRARSGCCKFCYHGDGDGPVYCEIRGVMQSYFVCDLFGFVEREDGE